LKAKAIFAAIFAAALIAGPAPAGQITNDLKSVTDRLVDVLKDASLQAPEKKDERRKRLRAIAGEKFDWEEMARRTLGRHWRERTPAEQKEFIEVFTDFLERTYLNKIDSFLTQQPSFSAANIKYLAETIEAPYALVDTKIEINEQSHPMSYKLIHKGTAWMVYDVIVEGVGIVANYRTQFNELLNSSPFKALIAKLKAKQIPEMTTKGSSQEAPTGAKP